MKAEKIKNIVIILLAFLLVMSMFTQALCFSLLGINNVKSFKRVMLASETASSPVFVEAVPEVTPEVSVAATEPVTDSTIKHEDNKANNAAVILNSNGIKVTYLGLEYSDLWDSYEIKFAVENNSDVDVTIVSRDIAIDGYMMDVGICFYSEVLAGKKSVVNMTLFDFELETYGIEKPGTVEFKLNIHDSNDVFKDIMNSDNIVINLT